LEETIYNGLFRLALKERATVYHFHDPELISIGLILKFFGKRVIYDVHEDYPKQILYKEWVGNIYVRRFVAFITNIIEQAGAFLFDGVVAATPDIAEKFNPSKTILLRNLPLLRLINDARRLEMEKEKPIIIYAGLLRRIRGIREIIQALEIIGDKAELWLLGEWESEEFKKECEYLEGWKHTKYLGFVPLRKVYEYIKVADIGISILYPIENYITSLPTKAFDYMACSLPMVMSDFRYWQEAFGDCALFANPRDPADIAEKVLYLLDNPDEAEKLGTKGRRSIEEEYNWEVEQRKLTDIYEKVLSK
jgi:glycosyltransferase involved in cell wall biosynthesis